MQRVLSFQMARSLSESSEYVTKRLCFSFLFSVGFLCILCGFLLGRFVTERFMEAQIQKTHLGLVENNLQNTEYLQKLTLQELEKISFDHVIDWETSDTVEANVHYISNFFSNLSFIYEVIEDESCVRATVRGMRETDRYIILSVNGDGITLALELIKVLNKIYATYDWRPQRSLIFCISLVPLDICPQILPTFMYHKIVAYIAVHGHTIRDDGFVILSGSDVMRFVAIEAIKTIPSLNLGSNNMTYLEYETLSPRLFLKLPQIKFSFNGNNLGYRYNENMRLHNVILTQMVSQTIWQLSNNIIIRWEPQYFNKTVNEMLKTIGNSFQEAKYKLMRTLKILLAAIKDLNMKINATENTQVLRIRIWNDLLLDLDKALLCSDENLHSRTDPIMFHKLSFEPNNKTLTYLDEITKCYTDAIRVLQEG